MLFLVYLLLALNITISFSSVVCKEAFFLLKHGDNCGCDYNYLYLFFSHRSLSMSLTRRTMAVRLEFFFTNIDGINTLLTPLFLQFNPAFMILRAIFPWLARFKYH